MLLGREATRPFGEIDFDLLGLSRRRLGREREA
jgi:hypothetical protein